MPVDLTNPVISTLTPAAALYVGRVIAAYDTMHFYRSFIKSAEAEVKSAKADYRSFGRYEDCGPSYENMLNRAETEQGQAITNVRQSEKYYKKMKHQLKESHPDALEVLEKLIPGSTKGFEQ